MALKKRTLNELRQTKDAVYSNKKSHRTSAKTKYVFSKEGLIKLLEDYRNVDALPEEFVNTIIP
tara:strand:- start:10791 stop:10982 length:192 start_codon:yes stop_codon:yes gene_type:complete